jgi:hypothetical protein
VNVVHLDQVHLQAHVRVGGAGRHLFQDRFGLLNAVLGPMLLKLCGKL